MHRLVCGRKSGAEGIAQDVENHDNHNENEDGEEEVGATVGDALLPGVALERRAVVPDGARRVIDGVSQLVNHLILHLDLVSHQEGLVLLTDCNTSNANLQIGKALTHRVKQSVDLLRILLIHLQRCLLVFCEIHFRFLELLPHIGFVSLVTIAYTTTTCIWKRRFRENREDWVQVIISTGLDETFRKEVQHTFYAL